MFETRARTRSSSARRSCSGRRIISSTASPRMARMLPALAAVRRRPHALPAGLRRRCRRAPSPTRSRARSSRGTIYELGGPEVKTFRECLELMLRDDRAAAPAGAGAVAARHRRRRPSSSTCRSRCSPSTRCASCRSTTSSQRRPIARGPHARRSRHRADQPRGDPAVLPLPLPRRTASSTAAARPERGEGRLAARPASKKNDRGQPDDADRDPPPAERREAVPADEAEEAAHHDQRRDEGDDEADGDDQRRCCRRSCRCSCRGRRRRRRPWSAWRGRTRYSAAERLSVPSSSAPTMVAPERDTPGISDRHWKRPMPSADAERVVHDVGVARLAAACRSSDRAARCRRRSARAQISDRSSRRAPR